MCLAPFLGHECFKEHWIRLSTIASAQAAGHDIRRGFNEDYRAEVQRLEDLSPQGHELPVLIQKDEVPIQQQRRALCIVAGDSSRQGNLVLLNICHTFVGAPSRQVTLLPD